MSLSKKTEGKKEENLQPDGCLDDRIAQEMLEIILCLKELTQKKVQSITEIMNDHAGPHAVIPVP